MRSHGLLVMSLLVLLLWASCSQSHDQHSAGKDTGASGEPSDGTSGEKPGEGAQEGEEEKPEREKTTEIEEDRDVMVLHSNNFDRALSENQYLLVEFYAPWCGHCQRLEPLYAEAAGKLKAEETGMRLAKVDAIEEKELADEFDVDGFPTLKVFINGERKQPVDFTGKRTVEGIIQWMKRRAGPGAPQLHSAEAAAEFIDAHNVTVVGFFDNLESEAARLFKEVAYDMADTEFAVTATPEVFKKYEVKENSVVLFKKFDDGRADFPLAEDGKLDKSNVTTFIKENSLDLIIVFSTETSEKIFSSSIRLHSLLFINSTEESHGPLLWESRAVAKEFKGKMLFVVIDVTLALSHVLTYFGVSASDAPTARLINMDTGDKFSLESEGLTADALRRLCREVVGGTAKPYYRTEEIPEDWDKGPVKVLVGKNFESVALDPTKNVFVEFYAPWCGHCQELQPVWEQLGEKYADRDDIIIAKMDATANEVESVVIQGFPTLKYFPAGDKEMVDYTGKRDLETFSKFLDNGGVLPKEGSDENDDDGDDDDDNNDDNDDEDDKPKESEEDDNSKEVDESVDVQENQTSKDEL
ncbi:protein disulfide-isomerase A2 [Betta splendens]|uniref:Protein disulfide-isomerase n=1 Tax=Betta splendens TaxID=158456 RepID=A0A6P7MJF0_BETSP|nr:protein disulfide-isomerase A2 [Betta splendens]